MNAILSVLFFFYVCLLFVNKPSLRFFRKAAKLAFFFSCPVFSSFHLFFFLIDPKRATGVRTFFFVAPFFFLLAFLLFQLKEKKKYSPKTVLVCRL